MKRIKWTKGEKKRDEVKGFTPEVIHRVLSVYMAAANWPDPFVGCAKCAIHDTNTQGRLVPSTEREEREGESMFLRCLAKLKKLFFRGPVSTGTARRRK